MDWSGTKWNIFNTAPPPTKKIVLFTTLDRKENCAATNQLDIGSLEKWKSKQKIIKMQQLCSLLFFRHHC